MKEMKTYSRTSLNGYEFELVETIFGGFALYRKNGNDFMYTGYSFRTLEDGIKHLGEIDARSSRPVQFVPCDASSFYGRGSSIYYGD